MDPKTRRENIFLVICLLVALSFLVALAVPFIFPCSKTEAHRFFILPGKFNSDGGYSMKEICVERTFFLNL